MQTFLPWVGLGLLIILPLAGYAGYLLLKLRDQTRWQQAQEQEAAQRQAEKAQEAMHSIRMLLIALRDQHETLTLTEAAIRVAALQKLLPQGLVPVAQLRPFILLAEATADIPFLEAWQQLSVQQKAAYDRQRIAAEALHEASIHESIEAVLDSLSTH